MFLVSNLLEFHICCRATSAELKMSKLSPLFLCEMRSWTKSGRRILEYTCHLPECGFLNWCTTFVHELRSSSGKQSSCISKKLTKHNNSILLWQKHGQQINTNSSHLSTQRIALLSSPNFSSSQLFPNLTICQCTSDPPCIWTNVLPWILHQNARTYEDHSISCWVSQHLLGYQSLVDDSQRLQANLTKATFSDPNKNRWKKMIQF